MWWILSAWGSTGDPEITVHLLEVASTLRAETPDDLPPHVRARRLDLLDALEGYAYAGAFPQGPPSARQPAIPPPRAFRPADHASRAPWFVDAGGTHCAAGYLISLDAPSLVAEVARRENGAFVLEMTTHGVRAWAAEHGFTAEELAWIQPGYPALFETCEAFEVRGSHPSVIAAACEGAAVQWDRTGDRVETRACKDCDESVRLWLPLWSTGSEDVVDLRVDLRVANPDTDADARTWALSLCGVDIPRGAGVAVGPIVLPGGLAVPNAGVVAELSLPGACELAPRVVLFDAPLLNWHEADVCDSGRQHETGSGTRPEEGMGELLPILAPTPCPEQPPSDTWWPPEEDTPDTPPFDTDLPTSDDTADDRLVDAPGPARGGCGCDAHAPGSGATLAITALFALFRRARREGRGRV